MEVLDEDLVARVDAQPRGAFFVFAELELAGSDVLAQPGFGVLVGIECQIVAGSSLEEVAFACLQARVTFRRLANAIHRFFQAVGALAFPVDHLLAIHALHLLSLAAPAIEDIALETTLVAYIIGSSDIMTLTTTVPFADFGSLEAGSHRAAGAVPLIRGQA